MNLDIGCSSKKLPGYVGMDILPQIGVDIVHDIEAFPWPVESDSCEAIHASHVLEHLKPWMLMGVMDEAWRVMKPGGEITIKTPYGPAYAFDPTHCILFQESSFYYFDPVTAYHAIYNPKPWQITAFVRDPANFELKTTLRKRETA